VLEADFVALKSDDIVWERAIPSSPSSAIPTRTDAIENPLACFFPMATD